MMKLCIVTYKIMKGNGQRGVNEEIIWEAINQGHHVTLLSNKIDPLLQQHERINWVDISVKKWPTEFIRNFVFSWRSSDWLHKHCREFDLVIGNRVVIFPGKTSLYMQIENFNFQQHSRLGVAESRYK